MMKQNLFENDNGITNSLMKKKKKKKKEIDNVIV